MTNTNCDDCGVTLERCESLPSDGMPLCNVCAEAYWRECHAVVIGPARPWLPGFPVAFSENWP